MLIELALRLWQVGSFWFLFQVSYVLFDAFACSEFPEQISYRRLPLTVTSLPSKTGVAIMPRIATS